MKKLKLEIELIPKTCFFSNVRSEVTKEQWDKIRKTVYKKANYICEICGGKGLSHPVECHEIWNYDKKNQVQKLERMIALCPNCHAVKHMGLSEIRGRGREAKIHLATVNNLNIDEAEKYIIKEFDVWRERSKLEWKLDISHLEEYGIDVKFLMKNVKSKS